MKRKLSIRGIELVQACIEKLKAGKNSKKAKAVSEKVLKTLTFPGGQALSPCLRYFLSYDLTFDSIFNDNGYHPPHANGTRGFGVDPCKPKIKRWGLKEVASRQIEIKYGCLPSYSKLKLVNSSGQPVKDILELCTLKLTGSFYPLPYWGEQTHFMYVGRANHQGEFPILGIEWEASLEKDGAFNGELWPIVKYPAFDVYLADMVSAGGLDGLDALEAQDLPEFKTEYQKLYEANPDLIGPY
jgi:hypothetical protein